MSGKPKAYSYIRFSSPKQAEGDSLRRQTEDRDGYCQRKGLILDTSLTLADLGVSAWKGDNAATGALAGFLDLCEKGTITKGSYLIVEHLDRLTRQDVRKALTLFFQILDAGVTIVTLQPEREYTPDMGKDPLSLIEPLILFANANEKSETLSKRLRDAWSNKRKERKPLTSWTPAWIRLTDDRSGYELIEEHADIVKKIVRLALDGYGDMRLVKKLNAEKWPVITDHPTWTNAFVSKMLRTPALIGTYEPGMERDGKRVLTGEVWEGYFPAVITTEEWYRLRAARQSRTYQRGPIGNEVANLFTGLLFNARDGEPYHRIMKNHARLISASYRNGLIDGDTQSFPYQPLENAFLYGLAYELKLQDLFGERPAAASDDVLLNLTAELADTDHNIGVVKDRINKQRDITAFLDVLANLEAKQKDIKIRLENERTRQSDHGMEADVLNDLQALARMWAGEHPDKADLRTKLKAKIRQIVAEMWMVVYGKKRSKFKTAEVQMYFRPGGSKIMVVHVDTDKFVSAELIERSSTGKAILPFLNFRLLNDPEHGERVRGYVEMMSKAHDDYAKSMMKVPEPRREPQEPLGVTELSPSDPGSGTLSSLTPG